MKIYRPTQKKKNNLKSKIIGLLNKIKLGVAVVLDLIDLILGNIPLLNSLWDIITFAVLFFILNDKRLALFSNIELLLPGFFLFGQIDAFIPIATILTLADISKKHITRNHDPDVIEMEEI
ncbi:hypothetical protein GF327_04695 [Candidatus Woesearchaeota archaeon]|nr:hypothetical protein [Candidatus Woesearchaeota archaeon]